MNLNTLAETARAMPAAPPEKVLVCSRAGLERLMELMPEIEVSQQADGLGGIKIVVRQVVPIVTVFLADASVLSLESEDE